MSFWISGTEESQNQEMYSNCLFCTADLGRNGSIEEFPVGRSLAFDAWKGRLWAVCPRCGRWNLAPILERWEAVESAERHFRETTLRVQSENVGLAELPDGTRLVRVGDTVPGELAAWRYGRELRGRRRGFLVQTGIGIALSLATGFPAPFPGQVERKDVVYRLPGQSSPMRKSLVLRRRELDPVTFRFDPDHGHWQMRLSRSWRLFRSVPVLELEGSPAQTVLDRMLVSVNRSGASKKRLEEALRLLDGCGSVEEYVRNLGRDQVRHGSVPILELRERLRTGTWRGRWLYPEGASRAGAPEMLALEMALQDQSERTAVAGELERLEARWHEAEEIAQIADSL